jgi:Domain of unknown function(DUF2779)
MPNALYLTKSRYTAGLQCLRRLWLNVHEPLDWDEPGSGSLEDVGLEIGRMAHLLFPGGILIEEKPWEHAAAVARTATLMADRSVPAIFGAAFEHSGVRVRVDVLERLRRGYWGIREVKSASEVKDQHYDDVAVQVYVLRNAQVRLSSVEILHVNTEYIRGQKGISRSKFFRRVEVKTDARSKLDGIDERLAKQLACLSQNQAPKIEPGTHCHAPYSCEHWNRCTASKPADWVFYLPKFGAAGRAELKALGVESISAIPNDFRLSPRQKIIRDVTRTGKMFVASDLSERLDRFGPPAFYLDFEAFLPAVPLYPRTRPYQTIPFQWSLHQVDPGGNVSHQEFLAEGDFDPRRRFSETLIDALKGTKWPIIVYSSYEETRLRELAATFPDLERPIAAISRRLSDLLPVVRAGLYCAGFEFSNSIKSVAPALCPDVTYDDLDDIADGTSASTAFWLMASARADAKTVARLRRSLRAYCHRDTWAMVRLHQALNAILPPSRI